MKSELKMRNKLTAVAIGLLGIQSAMYADTDTIPSMLRRPLEWHIGAEVSPAPVLSTNSYLKGDNPYDKKVGTALGGDLRFSFSFSPETCEGMLYKGLYQGIGIGVNGYFPSGLLGTPVSAYVYQGAPVVYLDDRLWLGYEWQFGAAFGWKHFNNETSECNVAVGSSVTAHLGLTLRLNYRLTGRWNLSLGIGARHFSNGNTTWPNSGVNTLGASMGIYYIVNPQGKAKNAPKYLSDEYDFHKWMYDIMVYGAWRKRVVSAGNPAQPVLCPGRFGVVGLQFLPQYRLNRWVTVGPALDLQWDESGGLEPYWVEGSYDENIKFLRPPFGKQISLGLSAHAELTMPIFSINVGLGYDVINPKGDKAFYQSLTLKTFITESIYINTGYRLGHFKDPQNLMLGFGIRL